MQTLKRVRPKLGRERPRVEWRHTTRRQQTSTMFLSSVNEPVNSIIADKNNSPDDLLRAIVDACVSNVAVLDESGCIIYASKAWDFLYCNGPESSTAPYFESCKRFIQPQLDDESTTLADDIQQILFGGEKEFHRKYYFQSLSDKPFVIHAARLNLPGPTFRVLITHEELPFVRMQNFRDSKERLIEILGTTILAWEGEVEGQLFTYVSEHAVKM